MGSSIARRLAASNHSPMVFDIAPQAMEAVGGCQPVRSPAEMLAPGAMSASGEAPAQDEPPAQCDIIAVVVLDDDQVADVVAGPNGLLEGFARSGGASRPPAAHPKPVVLIHSTVQPETVSELARQASRAGLTILDAPVTGGPAAAESGDLVVMLGGPPEACEWVAPQLSDYVGLALRMGDWGAGQRAKIARNLITYCEWMVAGEATALAEAAEVDVEQFWRIIEHSDRHIGTHGGFGNLRQLVSARGGAEVASGRGGAEAATAREIIEPVIGLARKDLELAAELARKVDCDPELAQAEQLAQWAAARLPGILLGE